MTTKQVDLLIKLAAPAILFSEHYNERITVTIVKRDRYTFETSDGGRFERSDFAFLQMA